MKVLDDFDVEDKTEEYEGIAKTFEVLVDGQLNIQFSNLSANAKPFLSAIEAIAF